MAARAYELKKRREDERKAIVQDKLYQQWRAGIDELKNMDSKIVQLKTIADRDFQLDEKEKRRFEDKEQEEFYDKLWYEGYQSKIARDEQEKAAKAERNSQLVKVLGVQLSMKETRVHQEKEKETGEAEEMQALWAVQEA